MNFRSLLIVTALKGNTDLGIAFQFLTAASNSGVNAAFSGFEGVGLLVGAGGAFLIFAGLGWAGLTFLGSRGSTILSSSGFLGLTSLL